MAYGCLGNFAGTRRRKKINQVGLTRETMFRTRDIVALVLWHYCPPFELISFRVSGMALTILAA